MTITTPIERSLEKDNPNATLATRRSGLMKNILQLVAPSLHVFHKYDDRSASFCRMNSTKCLFGNR